MDFKVIRQTIAQNGVIYAQNVEQSVDCEFNLPDYCQNIGRILKCQLTGRVGSAAVGAGNLNLEGMALVWILYVSDAGELCSYELPVSFSKNVEITGDGDGAVAYCAPSCDYVNCRAVTERKLDVHGALTLKVRVVQPQSCELLCGAEGGGLQLQKSMLPATESVGVAQKIISVNEEIDVGQSMSAIKNILRTNCRAVYSECKVLSGKMMIKGEILLDILYNSVTGGQETAQSAIPFNQIIDMDGADENNTFDVSLSVAGCDCKLRTGQGGEIRSVMAAIRISVTAQVNRETELPAVCDAYSTMFELSAQRSPVNILRQLPSVQEQFLIKQNVSMNEGETAKIIHLWCEPQKVSAVPAEGGIQITGTALCSIISQNGEGIYYYTEKPLDFEHLCPVGGELPGDAKMECDVSVVQSSFVMLSGNELEVRAELNCKCSVTVTTVVQAISSIELDESKPKADDSGAALYIYYGKAGENIWSIAQRYNTLIDDMCEINDISGETLAADKMLLIPRF